MALYRSFFVWGGFAVLILGLFLGFVLGGWPGTANSCIPKEALALPVPPAHASAAARLQYQDKTVNLSTCYCEAFWLPDVVSGAPGVRQPVNTWFNLYSLITSFVVALFVYIDRNNSSGGTPIRSHAWLPDLYTFVVLFLGLGSMWFHGALKEWGGLTDTLSMYMYASFLVFYAIYQLWDSDWFFVFGYAGTVALFTIFGELWQQAMPTFPVSLIMILALVVAYLIFQSLVWANTGSGTGGQNWWDHVSWRGQQVSLLWWLAVASIGLATFFWVSSQTVRYMCDPHSGFQPHGLLWHPLAGVMALLLYFYWRQETA